MGENEKRKILSIFLNRTIGHEDIEEDRWVQNGEKRNGLLKLTCQEGTKCRDDLFYDISQGDQHLSFISGFYNYTRNNENQDKSEIFFVKGELYSGYFKSTPVPFELYINAVKSIDIENKFAVEYYTNDTLELLIVGSTYIDVLANASIKTVFNETLLLISNKTQLLNNMSIHSLPISDIFISCSYFQLSTDAFPSYSWYAFWLLPLCFISLALKTYEYRVAMRIRLRVYGNLQEELGK